MAICKLYWDENFDEDRDPVELRVSITDFRNLKLGDIDGGNWNDEVSSIRILEGSWVFYEHINFTGRQSPVLGPGNYPNMASIGLEDNTISSCRSV